ncbi:MAG: hypothetical protein RSC60_07550, partial [Christensenellaceae bacterium]
YFPIAHNLREQVIDAIREDGTLVMTDAPDFLWDEMWFGGKNYYDLSELGKDMGVEFKKYRIQETGAGIFFLKDKKVVRTTLRGIAMNSFGSENFATSVDGKRMLGVWRFTPETAVFKTEVDEQGNVLLLPLDKDTRLEPMRLK